MKGMLFFTQSQKIGLALFAGLLLVVIAATVVFDTQTGPEAVSGIPSSPEQSFEQPALPESLPLRLDINLADSADLIQLRGIGEVLAARIVKYRQAIGGFQSVDDLANVYRLDAEVLNAIRPNLYVDPATLPGSDEEEPSYQQGTGYQGPKLDVNTASAEDFEELPGIGTVLSQRIVNFREKKGGYQSIDEVAKVYQLSPETFLEIRPHLTMSAYQPREELPETVSLAEQTEDAGVRGAERAPAASLPLPASVNINTADSAELVAVPGIGPVLSVRILKYRKLLGFYASTDMLEHVYGMSEENLIRMKPFLTTGDADSYPRKDLNTAYGRGLAFYPFLGQELAQDLLARRRELGRFDTWEEVALIPGMTPEALEGLKQYFHL